MKKAWFMARMEYNPNGKSIMVPMEYNNMVYSPNGKGAVLWKTLFRNRNGRGKR